MPSSTNTRRRWERFPVDLPVGITVCHGSSEMIVPGLGLEMSKGGMSLCVGAQLNPGDLTEIEFETLGKTRVTAIVRCRSGYCFGLEFLNELPH
ncbi:MAG: PilZ domain-containing protein [Terriglobales bacterium]